MFDFTKGYLPFATVCSLVVFVAWSTRVVTKAQLETDGKFVETARIVKELAIATKDIAESIVTRDAHTWTREDMVNWCERQTAKIPDLVCPVLFKQPYSKINDSLQGFGQVKRKLEGVLDNPALKATEPE